MKDTRLLEIGIFLAFDETEIKLKLKNEGLKTQ